MKSIIFTYSPLKNQIKAQVKIQQMAFVLMAITLFFIIVGLFVLVFKISGIKESATEICKENAIKLIEKLANSPEFSCGQSFGTDKVNCVDFDKVMALKQQSQNYEGFWGVSNIEIRKIYPENNKGICDLNNYPNCNIIQLKSGEIKGTYFSTFVSLCRKEKLGNSYYNKCEIAKLMVSYEWEKKC